jgi:hypothetical protein
MSSLALKEGHGTISQLGHVAKKNGLTINHRDVGGLIGFHEN